VKVEWIAYAEKRLDLGVEYALAATSRPYYDLLAYEDDHRYYAHIGDNPGATSKNPLRLWAYRKRYVFTAQRELTSSQEITCTSAFNGACAYLDRSYARATYVDDPGVCDHIAFNRVLASEGGHMIVDPTLVVPAPPEHVNHGFLRFLMRWVATSATWNRVVRAPRAVRRSRA